MREVLLRRYVFARMKHGLRRRRGLLARRSDRGARGLRSRVNEKGHIARAYRERSGEKKCRLRAALKHNNEHATRGSRGRLREEE